MVVQDHLETYLLLADDPAGNGLPRYVERNFCQYLECGVLAHGFAREYCSKCGHDFLVDFFCEGRAVCPSRTTRRMAETVVRRVDHVFPPLPLRQWVLSLPKSLRYFLRQVRRTTTSVLTIFLRVVEQVLRERESPKPQSRREGAESQLTFIRGRPGSGGPSSSRPISIGI